jgi:hypothetical protein
MANLFSDLKVLDIATFIAGAGAPTILSDFGVDVIKIEAPGMGDPYRDYFKEPPNPASPKNYTWQFRTLSKDQRHLPRSASLAGQADSQEKGAILTTAQECSTIRRKGRGTRPLLLVSGRYSSAASTSSDRRYSRARHTERISSPTRSCLPCLAHKSETGKWSAI